MIPTCYIQPDKEKSQKVLEAFAEGARAQIAWTTAAELSPRAAPIFYGVRPAWAHLWEQAKREGRDWWYIDNSYFDVAREKYFRVTKNAIQHSGQGASEGKRFAALGIRVEAMHEVRNMRTIVACAQSDEFMRVVAEDREWLSRLVAAYRMQGHQVLVRYKNDSFQRPLKLDLEFAKLLVTWSSAAAVTALLAGVPVQCSPQCCAYQVKDRKSWAEVLADNQWTLEEMASGRAWRKVR